MQPWPVTTRTPRQIIIVLFAASGLLAGCGQKGDLILPDPEITTTPTVAEPTPGSESNAPGDETDDEQ
ncbi:MAG: hypothetical protein E2O51_03660 [Gammaproteobacteria bacterium]|nr:MAG: hypothetical protein E2O51_03660 [Gammaproteobacteria bacterium]